MKKKFLFRKCALAIGLFSSVATLSSCSAFFGGDEYTITSTDVKTDENGNTIVTVNFNGEDIAPLTFTIPASTKGISSVTSEVKENQVVLTINFNDGTNQQIGVPVINGKDGVGISEVELIEDESGKYIRFHYTDGTISEDLALPKGNDGVGIKNITQEINEDGSVTYTMSFTDDREEVEFTIQNGVSIVNMSIDYDKSDEDFYMFVITFSDGNVRELRVEKPQTNKWLTGNVNPSSDIGKIGDFYINLNTGWVYQKNSNDKWQEMFCMKGEGQEELKTYIVTFNLQADETVVYNDKVITGLPIFCPIVEGECLSISSIPIPSKEGYNFEGRYSTLDNPNSGKFTDLTQVSSNINLYARRNII